MAQYIADVAYGETQPLLVVPKAVVVAKRAPGTGDLKYQLGQLWLNQLTGLLYFLASKASNSATWTLLESGGGAGAFSTLSSTGSTTLATAGVTVNTFGNNNAGTTLQLSTPTGTTVVTDNGLTATAGNISATAGSVSAGTTVTAGTGITATTGNIVASTGNITSTLGSVAAATTVTAGTSITATLGNITATNGNVVLSTAATFVQLPGPIKIMSGAGAPANGLAAEAGDLYIRTDPAGATSRIYVATAANTWTNVTCAA